VKGADLDRAPVIHEESHRYVDTVGMFRPAERLGQLACPR
jgi:hypothetical protein